MDLVVWLGAPPQSGFCSRNPRRSILPVASLAWPLRFGLEQPIRAYLNQSALTSGGNCFGGCITFGTRSLRHCGMASLHPSTLRHHGMTSPPILSASHTQSARHVACIPHRQSHVSTPCRCQPLHVNEEPARDIPLSQLARTSVGTRPL